MTTNSEYVTLVEQDARKNSIAFEGGEMNWPYAFGWVIGNYSSTLDELNLTDEQKKILEKRGIWLAEKA